MVSVIMPVYNGARFIKKGIESIIGQTYREIELIIVDDGSKDNSGVVIRKCIESLTTEDISIKYIRQENKGVAEARNTGMKAAKGEYIMFLDQDDWYGKQAVEILVKEARATQADVVISGYHLVDTKGKIKITWNLNSSLEWSKFRIVAPWGKLFRKAVIDEHEIEFLNTKISEDLYFNIVFMSYTNKVHVISEAEYYWLENKQSESRTNWNVISEERNPLYVLECLQKKTADSICLKREIMTYYYTKYLVWYLLYNTRDNEIDAVKRMYYKCFAWLDNNYPGYKKWSITGGMFPKGEMISVRFIIAVCVLMHKMKLFSLALLVLSKL